MNCLSAARGKLFGGATKHKYQHKRFGYIRMHVVSVQQAIASSLCTSRKSVREIQAYFHLFGTVPAAADPLLAMPQCAYPAGLTDREMIFLKRLMSERNAQICI